MVAVRRVSEARRSNRDGGAGEDRSLISSTVKTVRWGEVGGLPVPLVVDEHDLDAALPEPG